MRSKIGNDDIYQKYQNSAFEQGRKSRKSAGAQRNTVRSQRPKRGGGGNRPVRGGNTAAKKKSSPVYTILIIVFLLIFLVSAGILGWYFYDNWKAEQQRKQAESLKDTKATQAEIDALPDGATEVDFAALFAKHPDFRAWIKIDGTKIDYPVVQGKDNNYYLRKNINGDYHRLGTVYVDYRNQFGPGGMSDNTVVYGHSASDGSYFKDILKYKQVDYYRDNKIIHFDTLYGKQDYVVIGAFMSGVYATQGELFSYHDFIQAQSAEQFNNFVNEVARRSYIKTNVPVEYGDKLLTLSTCDYEFKDSRFVVVARQLREGETAEGLKVSASENKGRFMPDAWYEAKGKTNPNKQ